MGKNIVVHVDKCTGCRICELTCSFYKEKVFNPCKSRIRIVKMEREGIDFPILCQQCEAPVCMDVCPVSAIKKNEQRVVLLDTSICVGCRACTIVCPYGAISMVNNKFVKCDQCSGEPKCVESCPTSALEYTKSTIADMPRKRIVAEILAKPVLKARGQKG